jgi:hypothetical protein
MIRTVILPSGALRHEVAVLPAALPAVAPAALEAAWEVARAAADAGLWGPARLLVFPDEASIALTDPDAACWAEAMARHVGLDSLPGLSLCLRLLALVEVLGRAVWLRGMFSLGPTGRNSIRPCSPPLLPRPSPQPAVSTMGHCVACWGAPCPPDGKNHPCRLVPSFSLCLSPFWPWAPALRARNPSSPPGPARRTPTPRSTPPAVTSPSASSPGRTAPS